MWQRIKCLFGRHVVSSDTVILELGAVFRADICQACKRPWVGPFLFNAWDESQTVRENGILHLRGTNPELAKYRVLGCEDELHEISEMLRSRKS